jgi:hypothetical protein
MSLTKSELLWQCLLGDLNNTCCIRITGIATKLPYSLMSSHANWLDLFTEIWFNIICDIIRGGGNYTIKFWPNSNRLYFAYTRFLFFTCLYNFHKYPSFVCYMCVNIRTYYWDFRLSWRFTAIVDPVSGCLVVDRRLILSIYKLYRHTAPRYWIIGKMHGVIFFRFRTLI